MVWSSEEEDVLRIIRDQSYELYMHHLKDYTYYNKLSIKYNVPILIISALNSLMAIALTDFVDQKYVSIINAVLSAGTGVLGSVQLFLKVNEKLSKSVGSSILYEKLYHKIRKELLLDIPNREQDSKTFVNECFNEFLTYIEKSNPIEKKKIKDKLQTISDTSSDRSIARQLLQLGTDSPRSEEV